ncbi:MAG: hypothetical protein H7A39_04140 [Chlamydiales bacterium]|nr:hypothetical protein [Chlamydiales bacterium]
MSAISKYTPKSFIKELYELKEINIRYGQEIEIGPIPPNLLKFVSTFISPSNDPQFFHFDRVAHVIRRLTLIWGKTIDASVLKIANSYQCHFGRTLSIKVLHPNQVVTFQLTEFIPNTRLTTGVNDLIESALCLERDRFELPPHTEITIHGAKQQYIDAFTDENADIGTKFEVFLKAFNDLKSYPSISTELFYSLEEDTVWLGQDRVGISSTGKIELIFHETFTFPSPKAFCDRIRIQDKIAIPAEQSLCIKGLHNTDIILNTVPEENSLEALINHVLLPTGSHLLDDGYTGRHTLTISPSHLEVILNPGCTLHLEKGLYTSLRDLTQRMLQDGNMSVTIDGDLFIPYSRSDFSEDNFPNALALLTACIDVSAPEGYAITIDLGKAVQLSDIGGRVHLKNLQAEPITISLETAADAIVELVRSHKKNALVNEFLLSLNPAIFTWIPFQVLSKRYMGMVENRAVRKTFFSKTTIAQIETHANDPAITTNVKKIQEQNELYKRLEEIWELTPDELSECDWKKEPSEIRTFCRNILGLVYTEIQGGNLQISIQAAAQLLEKDSPE